MQDLPGQTLSYAYASRALNFFVRGEIVVKSAHVGT